MLLGSEHPCIVGGQQAGLCSLLQTSAPTASKEPSWTYPNAVLLWWSKTKRKRLPPRVTARDSSAQGSTTESKES